MPINESAQNEDNKVGKEQTSLASRLKEGTLNLLMPERETSKSIGSMWQCTFSAHSVHIQREGSNQTHRTMEGAFFHTVAEMVSLLLDEKFAHIQVGEFLHRVKNTQEVRANGDVVVPRATPTRTREEVTPWTAVTRNLDLEKKRFLMPGSYSLL